MIKKTALLLLASVTLAACSYGTTTTTPKTPGTQAPAAGQIQGKNDLVIQSFTFTPKTLTVQKGQTVNIMNNDTVAHTMTSRDKKSFDTGTINPGQSASFTAPDKAGTYAFQCNFHKSMTGTLIVQ